MARTSRIEWTEATWNPVTGCTKVSDGCRNCYAERMAKRLQAMGCANYERGFRLTLHPHVLDAPLSWKRPQIVFVCSMSDLFHAEVPLSFIQEVFEVMGEARWHTFQLLTKRAARLAEVSCLLPWPDNVWVGVTVEAEKYLSRVDRLRNVGAPVRFLSLEPLLTAMPEIDLRGIDWVIVGGESGPGARAMKSEWVRSVRDQCVEAGVPFFFKQWGGVFKKRNGRTLDGRTWDQMPESVAQIQETTATP